MNKKLGISTIGFAIIFVIVLAIIMIISAPMMIEKTETNNTNNNTNNLEERVEALERNSLTSKYICTVAGNLDENGTVVQLESTTDPNKKVVFVCEYK